MSGTITYLEFRAVGGDPTKVKLYAIGGIEDGIIDEDDSPLQEVDSESDESGRWRGTFVDLAAGDYQLIAFSAGDAIVADERYTLPSGGAVDALQPWSEAKPLTVAEIAAAVSSSLSTGTIEYVSPYNQQTSVLTLAQRADYKTGTVIGPLRWEIDNADIDAGDTVRFGAALNRPFLDAASNQTISATGTVIDEAGTLYAVIELSKEEHTDRLPGTDWRWELEHVDNSGNVSPLYSDQQMILKPSRGN
jgi:hypothetical protein